MTPSPALSPEAMEATDRFGTMPPKSERAYSSDGIRCRGFRPAEAGEGACGPLRSPECAP
jgi:hypothetical protein